MGRLGFLEGGGPFYLQLHLGIPGLAQLAAFPAGAPARLALGALARASAEFGERFILLAVSTLFG
ncbi:hypothetical protein D3C75_872540 [compost metagenome]